VNPNLIEVSESNLVLIGSMLAWNIICNQFNLIDICNGKLDVVQWCVGLGGKILKEW